ncbi:MAG: 4Fe-4S dicluster domain-containing protein [Brevinematales bacterium]|nr:4Fe-4S dicluster domain-containing protein [Brevinematales bacterium]
MKRKMIVINHDLCDGCGLCIPQCPEGALQIIDGKARLVSEFYCDGLGACVGRCPKNALRIEEREAQPYDEEKTIENILSQGRNVIDAHLNHLVSHNQWKDYEIATHILSEKKIPFTPIEPSPKKFPSISGENEAFTLTNWPIQLHLVNTDNEIWYQSHILFAADCTAVSLPTFHTYAREKKLLIACPKLDIHQEVYREKLITLFKKGAPVSFTLMIMEVPCCRGLAILAQKARDISGNNIPIRVITVGIEGSIVKEEEI